MRKRVLVTGAGGFIGSHLTSFLKREGWWVRGIDIKEPEFRSTEADDFRLLDLRDRALFRVIDRADIAEFSVLKTYDPPLTALTGAVLTDVTRHGKFLDLITRPDAGAGSELHLITHLARGGWLRPGVTTWVVGEVILYEILGARVTRVKDKKSGFSLLQPVRGKSKK